MSDARVWSARFGQVWRRIVGGRGEAATPPQADIEPPVVFTPGHPDSPLTENFLGRRRLAEALATLAQGRDEAALATLDAVTAWRPGLAPEGACALHLDGLRAATVWRPHNLSLRLALAEALAEAGEAEEGARLAISVLRESRPPGGRALTGSVAAFGDVDDEAARMMRFHSVDLGETFLEGSPKNALVSAREALRMHWPDLAGKTVLDIGAYGGWFSFEAERRGAAKVTANDFYAWMVDYPLVWPWLSDQRRAGIEPHPYTAPFPINDPQGQPGRRLFDLTRGALGSTVTPVFGPVETTPLEVHDIVLLLGVLYHTEDPLGLLRRAYALTGEMLILETLSFEYTANLAQPIWRIYGRENWHADSTTVWAPSSMGLVEALKRVGFKRVEVLYGWDSSGYFHDWDSLECRLWVHAYKEAEPSVDAAA